MKVQEMGQHPPLSLSKASCLSPWGDVLMEYGFTHSRESVCELRAFKNRKPEVSSLAWEEAALWTSRVRERRGEIGARCANNPAPKSG